MNIEARVIALEERVMFLEHKVKEIEPKIDQALHAIVDLHDDVRRLDRKVDQLRDDLPDIIARAVAPLVSGRG